MTTIVAVEKDGAVKFASDTRVSGGHLNDGWVEKVVRNGEFVFAAAGYLRTIQILQYAKLPNPPSLHPFRNPSETDRFVTKELVPSIKAAFAENDDEDAQNGSVILASVSGRVYELTPDGAWTRNPTGIYAVGSGSEYAIGALQHGATPIEAIKIAALYDSGTNDDAREFEFVVEVNE